MGRQYGASMAYDTDLLSQGKCMFLMCPVDRDHVSILHIFLFILLICKYITIKIVINNLNIKPLLKCKPTIFKTNITLTYRK